MPNFDKDQIITLTAANEEKIPCKVVAEIIYEAVIYWQDFFFGSMLQETWDDAQNDVQPRKRSSKANDDFEALPEEFTANDLVNMGCMNLKAAQKRLERWKKSGYIEVLLNSKPVQYKKVVKAIVV